MTKCFRCGSSELPERFYEVRPGDSLWAIALRYTGVGSYYTDLLPINQHVKNPDMLPVGEILNIPEHWAKIKELGISGDRVKFGQDVIKELLQLWVTHCHYNSSYSISKLELYGTFPSEREVKELLAGNTHLTAIVIGHLVKERLDGIFPISFFLMSGEYHIKVGDLAFNAHSREAPPIPELMKEVCYDELLSNFGPRLNLEEVRMFTGFCAQMGLQVPECVDKL